MVIENLTERWIPIHGTWQLRFESHTAQKEGRGGGERKPEDDYIPSSYTSARGFDLQGRLRLWHSDSIHCLKGNLLFNRVSSFICHPSFSAFGGNTSTYIPVHAHILF